MTCQSSGRSPTIAIGLGPLLTPSRIRIPRPPTKRTTFTEIPPLWILYRFALSDFELRNGEDQAAAPHADIVKLLADFLPEVPGQHEHVVGFCLLETLRSEDRYAGAWQELALLHRAPVDGVGQQVGADPAVIQQRVALAGGAVTSHRLARLGRVEQEPDEFAFDGEHLAREAGVTRHQVQAGCLFAVEHRLDPGPRLSSTFFWYRVHAQRPAVRRQLVDVDDPKSGGGQRPRRGQQRQVREVLVIDRVVLALLDQPRQMRELKRDQPSVLDQSAQAGGEASYVGHVGEDVVGRDEVGLAMPVSYLLPGLRPEEGDLCPDADGYGGLGDVRRRLDAKHRNTGSDKVPKQVAVVARHLGHEAALTETEPGDHPIRVPLRVSDPRVGVRREIGIIGKNVLTGYVHWQLHEQAFVAYVDMQRIKALGIGELVGGHVALAQRGHPQ